jgi:hypothetical protein
MTMFVSSPLRHRCGASQLSFGAVGCTAPDPAGAAAA